MSVRSWRQIVLDADPDWQRLSRRPWVYEFSNGRRFNDPDPLYGAASAGIFILDESLLDGGDVLSGGGPFVLDESALDDEDAPT